MIDGWCITPLGGGMLGSHMASCVIENIATHSLSSLPPRGMFHSSLWAQETCCDRFDRRKSAEVVDRGLQGWLKNSMTSIEFSPSSLFKSYYKAGVPWDLQPERGMRRLLQPWLSESSCITARHMEERANSRPHMMATTDKTQVECIHWCGQFCITNR